MDQHAITETPVDPQMVGEIARFFRQILRSEEPHVGEATSFFALGGSSLVDHPTPAALARHVAALRVGASAEQDEEEIERVQTSLGDKLPSYMVPSETLACVGLSRPRGLNRPADEP